MEWEGLFFAVNMEYEYVGYTAERRVTKGKITADNENDAGGKLSRDGYQVLSLKTVAAPFFTAGMPSFFEKGAKQEEIIMFSRQLALLLESGVGIVQSLELLKAQTTNKALAKMLDIIVIDLRAGNPLSASLLKHPKAFNKMYCKIVAVGEQIGQLEGVLRNLASYEEQSSAAARKIKQAMTYPIIVLVLAVAVGFLAVTFVLPPIMDMFKTLGGQLPLITQILIAVVMFMGSYGVYVMLAVVVACLLLYRYSKTPNGTLMKDRLMLSVPVIGRLNQVNALSRICRSITLLFRSGLPLPDILTLTAESSGNKVISNALMQVEQDIIKGDALAMAMRKQPVFLPLMVEMTRVGEETGKTEVVMQKLADFYEDEVNQLTRNLSSIIEPVLMLIMGGAVGFFAVSMMQPMYSVMANIK